MSGTHMCSNSTLCPLHMHAWLQLFSAFHAQAPSASCKTDPSHQQHNHRTGLSCTQVAECMHSLRPEQVFAEAPGDISP